MKRMKKWNAKNLYDVVMTGVTYFLPVIVAGGVIGGMAPLFKGAAALWLAELGGAAFSLVLPVLSGYIALAIADRPGLVPGLVAGLAAAGGGTGVLGALVGGLLAGAVMVLLKRAAKSFPRSLEATKTLVLFPIAGTLMAALMMWPVNLLAPLNAAFCGWVNTLSLPMLIVFAVVLCVGITVDLGGPVNKAAYIFSVAALLQADGSLAASTIMAMVAAGGMTLGLGCGLATTLFPKKYGESMHKAGRDAYILGLSYVSEGALPFAGRSPRRVYPALMLGSVTAGVIVAIFGVSIPAPIGGVFTIPLASKIPAYLLAVAVGSVLNGVLQGLLAKKQDNGDEL